jgi:hypothetical protein
MKSNKNWIWCVLSIFRATNACDLINPDEPIPATIHLNRPVLQVEPGQGSARHKITEVWIYANSNFEGAFSPPVDVHYVTNNALTNFSFWGGIRNNGILSAPVIYPLYVPHTAEINTTPGAMTEVTPVIRYHPDAVFSMIADFEVQNDFIDNRDTVPESDMIRSSVDPYEGSFSGEMIMDSIANFIEVGHAIALANLPVDGTAVYLEFDYKTEIEMSVGLLGIPLTGQSFSNFFYLVKPSPTWNKIYIEITDLLVASQLPAYKVLFRSLYPPNAPQDSYRLQIDNIKVVHL